MTRLLVIVAGVALAMTTSPAHAAGNFDIHSASISLGPSASGDTQATIHVDCPSGELATGGGADVVNGSGDSGFTISEKVQFSRPRLVSGLAIGWEAGIDYSTTMGSFTGTLTAHVICSGL